MDLHGVEAGGLARREGMAFLAEVVRTADKILNY
jgi:hypothetical protein